MNKSMKEFFKFIFEVIRISVIALAIVIPIRYFLIQPFFVKGASMEPNFEDNEYLVIDEISYRFREPKRGEVIVFKYPYDPRDYYIKRIIGLPGETIEIKDNQVIIYNSDNPEGKILNESNYLTPEARFHTQRDKDIKIMLESDEYYVMGDNRKVSSDSRTWGKLEKKFITGRVWLRAWPLNRISVFKNPAYNNFLIDYIENKDLEKLMPRYFLNI